MDIFELEEKLSRNGNSHIPIEQEPINQRREVILEVALNIDFKFWAVLPAININLHSNTFEFEWLCFAVYIDKK